MLPVPSAAPDQGEYVLPHEDVVLFALIHVANMNGIHPWSIARGIARRPSLNYWMAGNTAAMHYSTMRLFIAKLVNQFGVDFDADGFTYKGKYTRARGFAPPAIIANPSAL